MVGGDLVEVGDVEDELGSLDRGSDAGVGAEEVGVVVVGEDPGVYETVDCGFGRGGPVAGVAAAPSEVGVDDVVDVGVLEGGEFRVAGHGPSGLPEGFDEVCFLTEVQVGVGVDEGGSGGQFEAPGAGAGDWVGEGHHATSVSCRSAALVIC